MSSRTNLDLDTLRTLATVHDLGGLAQAAERLGVTPSAVSLQLKRVQHDLGTPIFRKRGRRLVLTEAGDVALAYARRILALNDELLDNMHGANVAGRIRVGCPQDFSQSLPSVLSHFASLYPRMQVELRIEGSGPLVDAIDKEQLDVAIVLGHDDRRGAESVGTLDLVWMASTTFEPPIQTPLPLAMLGPQCVFRKTAVQSLEEAKIPFRIAATSPSLDGLWAALLGGLGVTVRTALSVRDGLVVSRSLHKLPVLGTVPVTLLRGADANSVPTDRIATLLTETIRLAIESTRGRVRDR
jgi:DNA-binding transcriptional LysR family regulator